MEQETGKSRFSGARASIIGAWLLIVLVPLPFLSNLLISEEGMFAYLVVKNGKTEITSTRDAILIGRENGVDRMEAPRHPIMPYWVMINILRPFSGETNFGALSIDEKSRKARLPFYILYVLAWIVLVSTAAWIWRQKPFKALLFPLGLLLFVGTWRLTVGGSVQTYYDGNYGVLLTVLCAAGLILASRAEKLKTCWFLLFGSGFLAALGKNEWALAFLAAIIGTAVIRWLYYRLASEKEDIKAYSKEFRLLGLALVSGILTGSAVHYLIDPFNYVQGFSVMVSFGIKSPASWSDAFTQRIGWIWPLAILTALAVPMVLKDFKRLLNVRFPQMVLLLWGIAMTCGFMIPPHMGDGFPRYFCPPLFALTAFILARGQHKENSGLPWKTALITGIAFLGLTVFNLGHLYRCHDKKLSIGTVPGRSLIKHRSMFKQQYIKYRRDGKARKVEAALGYYFPEMDFINNT